MHWQWNIFSGTEPNEWMNERKEWMNAMSSVAHTKFIHSCMSIILSSVKFFKWNFLILLWLFIYICMKYNRVLSFFSKKFFSHNHKLILPYLLRNSGGLFISKKFWCYKLYVCNHSKVTFCHQSVIVFPMIIF